MNIYDFKITDIDGKLIDFKEYKGKVMVIVNTASKCGFTPQFQDLEKLYQKYKEDGLIILGFPCNQFLNQDPGGVDEIKSVCLLNYGVTFKMFQKINVNGKDAHPLFEYLKKEKGGFLSKKIKWNFTKFIVDRNGNVADRIAPNVSPMNMEATIIKLLKE